MNQGPLQNGYKCIYSWQGENREGKWDGRCIFLSMLYNAVYRYNISPPKDGWGSNRTDFSASTCAMLEMVVQVGRERLRC
jgi:hypothetical protein